MVKCVRKNGDTFLWEQKSQAGWKHFWGFYLTGVERLAIYTLWHASVFMVLASLRGAWNWHISLRLWPTLWAAFKNTRKRPTTTLRPASAVSVKIQIYCSPNKKCALLCFHTFYDAFIHFYGTFRTTLTICLNEALICLPRGCLCETWHSQLPGGQPARHTCTTRCILTICPALLNRYPPHSACKVI
jgi:hypothetical protein